MGHNGQAVKFFANDMLSHLTGTLGMSWNVAANAMLQANVRGDAWLPEHYLTAEKWPTGLALYTLTEA